METREENLSLALSTHNVTLWHVEIYYCVDTLQSSSHLYVHVYWWLVATPHYLMTTPSLFMTMLATISYVKHNALAITLIYVAGFI
uniref:Uncharacterized protein n=1 Tax=Kalanchoe fedtschenkoi TaxID=63787 RepID=A0A7N0UMM4_KALFE